MKHFCYICTGFKLVPLMEPLVEPVIALEGFLEKRKPGGGGEIRSGKGSRSED